MKNKSTILIILVLVAVSGVFYYFAAVYKNPVQIQKEQGEMVATIQKNQGFLSSIEEYLSIREREDQSEFDSEEAKELSSLQDLILDAGDGLITAEKADFVAFDRQTKALRTILSMEVDALNSELNK